MKKIIAVLALIMAAAVFSYAQEPVNNAAPAKKIIKIKMEVKKDTSAFVGKVGSINVNSTNSGKIGGTLLVKDGKGKSKTFSLDNSARVSDENGASIEPGELKVGKYVSVNSAKDATGELVAKSIEVLPPPKSEEKKDGE